MTPRSTGKSIIEMNMGYPAHVNDVIDLNMTYPPQLIACVNRFARSKPWRGTLDDREAKFQLFHVELSDVLGVDPPKLIFTAPDELDSSRSCYIPACNTIILRGPLSAITFLHEWAHRWHGPSESQACRWSINLFRVCFPRSFARCRFEGHMVRAIEAPSEHAPE